MLYSSLLTASRYITVGSKSHLSLTHSKPQTFLDNLKPTLCPTHQRGQDRTSPVCRVSRLFEASTLLDKIHATLNNPSTEQMINLDEFFLTIQTVSNLQTILNEEIGSGVHLYNGGWVICNM